MKTAADCSSGLTLRLDSIKSAGSLHRNGEEQEQEEEQEEEEKQEQEQEQEEGKKDEELEQQTDEGLEGVLVVCQPQARARPLCMRGRMTRDEVGRKLYCINLKKKNNFMS